MRRFLLATSCLTMLPLAAQAADLGVRAAAPVAYAPPPSLWTGSYIGIHAGAISSENTTSIVGYPPGGLSPAFPASYGLSGTGFIGGVQAGYNYQLGAVVLGYESDFSFTDNRERVSTSGAALGRIPFNFRSEQRLDWLSTSRVRVGVLPTETVLLYATAGVAAGRVTASTNLTLGNSGTESVAFSNRQSDTQVGWTAGAGVEWAFAPSWKVRAEYLYYDLGGTIVVGLPSVAGIGLQTHQRFEQAGHVARIGLDYTFDFLGLIFPASAPVAAPGMVTKAPVLATATGRPFELEVGTRFFFSTGSTQNRLYGGGNVGLASRLTYDNLGSYANESYARLDTASGIFVKGFAGLGRIDRGNLRDEDLPPLTTPFSATNSPVRDSRLQYLTADIGYSFLRGPLYRVGAFVGFSYYGEKLNALGCSQVGGNPDICVPSFGTDYRTISLETNWYSARIGLAGEAFLTDRLRLSAEAAYVPYTRLDARDTHFLRLGDLDGINGATRDDGTGSGVQAEVQLNYQVTQVFSLGVGARYQYLSTNSGTSHYEAYGYGPQPTRYTTERYGGFVQGAFKF